MNNIDTEKAYRIASEFSKALIPFVEQVSQALYDLGVVMSAFQDVQEQVKEKRKEKYLRRYARRKP